MPTGSLLRKAAKLAVLPAGLVDRRRPGDVAILLYHRVGVGSREIDLTSQAFAEQVDVLRATDRILSLDGSLTDDAGGVVLTFDDGTEDFHRVVVPLLVRSGVPATLYLATGSVGEPGSLTWGSLEEVVATGLVTVGAHTHSHADLARASERDAEEEMRRSKDLIEDRLGVACRHFAYPFAVASPEAERAARRVFDTAALDAWRTNKRGTMDPYRLGRTPVLRSDGPFLFRMKVAGRLDGEALLYRALRRGPWSH